MLSISPINLDKRCRQKNSNRVSFAAKQKVLEDSLRNFPKNSVIGKLEVGRSKIDILKFNLAALIKKNDGLENEYYQNMHQLSGGWVGDFGTLGQQYMDTLFKKMQNVSKYKDKTMMGRTLKAHQDKKETETIVGLNVRLEKLIQEQNSGSNRKGLTESIDKITSRIGELKDRNKEIELRLSENRKRIAEIEEQLKKCFYTVKE